MEPRSLYRRKVTSGKTSQPYLWTRSVAATPKPGVALVDEPVGLPATPVDVERRTRVERGHHGARSSERQLIEVACLHARDGRLRDTRISLGEVCLPPAPSSPKRTQQLPDASIVHQLMVSAMASRALTSHSPQTARACHPYRKRTVRPSAVPVTRRSDSLATWWSASSRSADGCVEPTASTVAPAALPAAIPAGASSTTRHRAGS